MGRRYLSDKIVEWYANHSRPLPWRSTNDPYKIWLSEIILQQTRVNQGLPYYHNFIHKYPRIQDLATAAEQEVLRLWQGLGYYTRARNLHKCAKAVHTEHNGIFPASYRQLLSLPGIGEYTAAAIASFAFGEPVAVLDGNVFRVLSRLFGIDTPINSPEGKKQFSDLANDVLSRRTPGIHNQAMMEFGALLCKPRNPDCPECPVKRSCIAFQRGIVEMLPVKTPNKKPRKRYFFYLVIERGNTWLMKQRSGKDIWQGLFDFVLIETSRPQPAAKIIEGTPYGHWLHGSDLKVSKPYVHKLTHQTIHCRFIRVKTSNNFEPLQGLSFYSLQEVAELPKPVLISRFLQEEIH